MKPGAGGQGLDSFSSNLISFTEVDNAGRYNSTDCLELTKDLVVRSWSASPRGHVGDAGGAH